MRKFNRWLVLKPAVFIACLVPMGWLTWAAFNGGLSANPISDITNETGVWTLRFLLITLTVTPLRWVTGWNSLIRFRRMLGLFAFALVWLATALGLAAKSVETASNTPMFLMLLVFLGSGFVPAATMPAGLEQFARYQPFTPVTETLRGLLTGTPIGGNGIAALAWSAGIASVSYLWAMHLYRHRRAS